MQKAFEKIVERLEEAKPYYNRILDSLEAKKFEVGQIAGLNDAIEIVNKVAEELDKGNISDGYHTFNELYLHRGVLFATICNTHKELAWKSKLHDTGDMYEGMFIVGIETPEGQATYHYDVNPYWSMFNVKELEKAPKWDGHTPDEAIRRIATLENFNDGWIPCSSGVMPDDRGEDWVQIQIQESDTGYLWTPRTGEYRQGTWWVAGFDGEARLIPPFEVVAWRPLPAPYQPKGE